MASNRNSDDTGLIILAIAFIVVIAIGLAILIAQWLMPFVLIASIIFLVMWIFIKDGMGNRDSKLFAISLIGFIISFFLYEIGYGFGNSEFGRMSVNVTKALLGK